MPSPTDPTAAPDAPAAAEPSPAPPPIGAPRPDLTFDDQVARLRTLAHAPTLTSAQLFELAYWCHCVGAELRREAGRVGVPDIALPLGSKGD